MKDYRYILFDLDGTITDSIDGITNSIIYALKKYDIEIVDRNELQKFIGPPLVSSFKNFCGFSEEDANEALRYFREYYSTKGIFESSVYKGIEELLTRLKSENKTLIVATSKPEAYARRILEDLEMDKYFSYIAGSKFDGTRIEKSDVIAYAMKSCGITDLSLVLMVGDRKQDIMGAKKTGIDSVGVLFGYGDRKELENAGATYIVETVGDLQDLLVAK
ncbi:phosphoglycolate phosphatase [Dethiosulfatibacter aminovorans DSM 17477]|uniref:Phosphoglycolate phosphatase n=1 Tax=Dethiosulfatibacter aminovorans DSM 17477 TaxID=1121476 RepID=A0A1M6AQZ8_9FIRM|nr:HAD family hydrolase [Dethiosulfatibacter aminovorans]SHI38817.1 phosphoglycolate phosphatase [Dethiosulfatibacter aminovorans DSM 17477]